MKDTAPSRCALVAILLCLAGVTPATDMQGVAMEGAIAAAGERPVPRVWRVGPTRALQRPSEAARLARDGDVVEIDAGVYANDHARWHQDGLIIRGVGGLAHLRSTGLIPNGKGIWITGGNDMVIENIEFSGAEVMHTNGAGIRHEGGNLTLRNTFFHDNEFSLLTGRQSYATIEVHDSRFWYQRRKLRFSHGIYVGHAGKLLLIGNHFKGTDGGHQIKSRAFENRILYNRIEDGRDGNSSRLIDLPNCGLSLVMGNELQQAATSENWNAIGFGPEGCEDRPVSQQRLFVIHNTFVNQAPGGTFVANHTTSDVTVVNNLVFGKGERLSGSGTELRNLQLPLADRPDSGWRLPDASAIIDRAGFLDNVAGLTLTPEREFTSPAGTRPRPRDAVLDIGAHEYTD